MADKEIIERIKSQLNDGFIDFNVDNDCDEMNYIIKAIYDLELYKKALDKAISIFNFQEICPNVLFGYGIWNCPNEQEIEHKCDCDECWKKYLLESEKQ